MQQMRERRREGGVSCQNILEFINMLPGFFPNIVFEVCSPTSIFPSYPATAPTSFASSACAGPLHAPEVIAGQINQSRRDYPTSEQSTPWKASKVETRGALFWSAREARVCLNVSSAEPKWIAAGVQTLHGMIIDFHHVIISSNHKIGLSTLGIILKRNYINFLVRRRILESLFIHKTCKLGFCLCIAEAS